MTFSIQKFTHNCFTQYEREEISKTPLYKHDTNSSAANSFFHLGNISGRYLLSENLLLKYCSTMHTWDILLSRWPISHSALDHGNNVPLVGICRLPITSKSSLIAAVHLSLSLYTVFIMLIMYRKKNSVRKNSNWKNFMTVTSVQNLFQSKYFKRNFA